MELNEFEKLTAAAVEELPPNIKNALKNVAVVVEDNFRGDLLGLYEGIPQNEWGKNDAIRLPDKITIFKPAIEAEAKTPEKIKELVKIVVRHEIAHYFGFDEPQTRALERRWRARQS